MPPPANLAGRRERRLFGLLYRGFGRVVTYEDISISFWPGDDPDQAKASIQATVCSLRKKLRSTGLRIETEWAIGYRMTGSEA